ncbi:MAG: ligase-associated DNA damage response endonuclease PdeM [Pseudomonadota bacterium]
MTTSSAFSLNGQDLVLDGRGAVFWPGRRLLVVADLHLAKAEALAAAGHLVPPYDARATLDRLVGLLNDHRPDRVLSLGDGFHRSDGYGRLAAEDRAHLDRLAEVCAWTWIAGNHDPRAPAGHGSAAAELAVGDLVFRHVPAPAPAAGEVAGHLHPRAAVRVRGRVVVRPCFATDGHRLLVPAFGAYTGGLDVWDPAIARLFARPFDVLLCGRDGKLRRLPAGRLEGRPRRASSGRKRSSSADCN